MVDPVGPNQVSTARPSGARSDEHTQVASVFLATQSASGARSQPEATVHEVPAFKTHLVFLAGTTISAGASTSGYLVVDNVSKTPITVAPTCDNKPSFVVIVSNPRTPHWVRTQAGPCSSGNISPGVHRYPFTVTASYGECTASASTPDAPGFPAL